MGGDASKGRWRNPSLEYLWKDLPEGLGIHGDLWGRRLQHPLLPGKQRIPEVSPTTQFLIILARIEIPGKLRRFNSMDLARIEIPGELRTFSSMDFLLFTPEGAPGTMGRE